MNEQLIYEASFTASIYTAVFVYFAFVASELTLYLIKRMPFKDDLKDDF